MSIDITETKAKALVEACRDQGLDARLFWDRGPHACQIMLTDRADSEAPSILFLVEDSEDYRISVAGNDRKTGGWIWHAQIQADRNHPDQDDLYDVGVTVVERTWLGDREVTVARKIALFLNTFTFTPLEAS